MKKLSEYTSKDGKFVHQAKAGRYGGSKPDVEKPMRAPKAKDIKDIEKDDKKPELSDHPFKFKKKTEGVDEKLVGNQHKLDHNKNGKLDADDFKKARAKKKGETAIMNPKLDSGKGDNSMEQKETYDGKATQSADQEVQWYVGKDGKKHARMVAKDKNVVKKESTIRQKLLSIFEKKDPHTAGAAAEPMNNNLKGAGAKQMKKDHEPVMPEVGNEPAVDKKNFADMAASTKKAPMRPNDNAQGDKNIVNPVDDITKKAPKKEDDGFKEGDVKLSTESFMDKVVAYLRK